VRYEFIRAEKANFAVTVLCRVLEVSTQGYYAWAKRGPSNRAKANLRLVAEIKAVHAESRRTYGAPRCVAGPSERRRCFGLSDCVSWPFAVARRAACATQRSPAARGPRGASVVNPDGM